MSINLAWRGEQFGVFLDDAGVVGHVEGHKWVRTEEDQDTYALLCGFLSS